MSRARLAWDLLRAEGLRGLAERLADRSLALRARFGDRLVPRERLARDSGQAPVLDVLATPLAPRFGGVPTQLGARLGEEARLRPTALLAPESGTWTLRATRGGETLRTRLGPAVTPGDPSRAADAGVRAILEAARLVGARAVNVEGVAGWPLAALGGLADGERKLVVSLHDFALFCPRPNLIEEPHATFCGYSRDAGRCRACLGATWGLPPGFVEDWRRDAEVLLAAADAVVYPSEFLRRQHAALFPAARPRIERVIAPPAPGDAGAGPAGGTRGVPREGPVHVAFVGAYRAHKGALVFAQLLPGRGVVGGRPVRWSVFGSGDPGLLLEARRRGARVAGHYRAGSLARRLRAEGVDLALLLSIWPETWALTLSECRAAGVPVLAFGHGAVADRIAAEGGGLLVPPEEGARGVAAMLGSVLAGEVGIPPFRGGAAGPSALLAATERMGLYRTLLGEAK